MTIENYKGLRLDKRLLDFSKQDIDYRKILDKYFLQKWYLYVFCTVLFVALAHFKVSTIEPTYGIKSKLLITEGERDSGSPEDWLKRSLNFSAIPDNVYNEIEVLTSFALVNSVVNHLNLDIYYFWEEKFSYRTGYNDFPVKVSSYELSSPYYYNEALKIIPLGNNSFRLEYKEQILGDYQYGEEFSNWFGTFCFELRGNPYEHEDDVMYVKFLTSDSVTEDFLNRLSVGFIDIKSTTLEIYLADPVPERGVEFLENLIIRYHQIKNQENNRVANNTLRFIDERLVDIGRDLRSIESSVENYKLRNDIADESTSDLQMVLQNANRLSAEKEDLEVQLNVLEAMKTNLSMSGTEHELIPLNRSTADLRLDELIKPYNELVLERRQMLISSQPSNPVVLSINQKLSSMRNSIYAAIENLQSDLKLRVENVKGQYEQTVVRLRTIPTTQRQLTDKSRQQAIVENLYTYLLQKREETALSLIGTAANSIVIDPPRSTPYIVSPNKMKYYMGGGFIGLALPFLLISVIEVLKDVVESEDHLKAMMPDQVVVGLINQRAGWKDRQIVMEKTRTLISDRFRSLRTNLQFLSGSETSTKCIMVTSSASREGKTFIASNLAVSFAMKGERTIIVDFDLRNAEVASYLGEDRSGVLGLKHYLQGEEKDVKGLIHTSEYENLDYITLGEMPENPDDLILTEKRLDPLFEYLKSEYDTVIVDTSPVGIISDAILLNKYISHSLYIVRVGVTKESMIEKARELFGQNQLINPLMVLNGVKKGEVYGYKVAK